MELTCWGQSGVRIARDGQALAIDPGAFTDEAIFDGVQAVLITHEHIDHVVPEKLAPRVAENPELLLWAPDPIAQQLIDAGAPAERVQRVAAGDTFTAAGLEVSVIGRDHAQIHPLIPIAANVAYLIEGALLHPGDSFTQAPPGISPTVLLLPVGGPWLKLSDSIDYLHAVGPEIAVPVHDAMLTDAGRGLADRIVSGLAGSTQYRRLGVGEPLTIA